MKHLIDKDVLASELERLRKNNERKEDEDYAQFELDVACGYDMALDDVKKFLDILDIKETNLEEELDEWMKYGPHTDYPWCTIPDAIKITAEHFFELGLKAQKGETILSKVKGYLVRDKDDYTAIYAEKPHKGKTEWVDGNDSCLMTINDTRLVPDIEFENEPVEVEVIIKNK